MTENELLQEVSKKLRQKHLTIATAESCTGGLLAHMLTNISGSSEYFERGVITYSNTSKMELLGVRENILVEYGAVSEQTAAMMAVGIRERSHVDIGVSTTGIAGPTGGTTEKPAGLVYIGVATKKNMLVKRFIFSGDRLANKESACAAALEHILDMIQRETS
jgi:nicotinamide-nucleotide amidase